MTPPSANRNETTSNNSGSHRSGSERLTQHETLVNEDGLQPPYLLDSYSTLEESNDVGFTSSLIGVINDQDIDQIITVQSEMCQSFLEFSQVKHQDLSRRFEQHTSVTKELQQDLESIFRRIRALKAKAMTQYPEQFNRVKQGLPDIVVEDD